MDSTKIMNGDHGHFVVLSPSDNDDAAVKQILASYSFTNGNCRVISSRELLRLVENILQMATTVGGAENTPTSDMEEILRVVEKYAQVAKTVQELTDSIHKMSAKIKCGCCGGDYPVEKTIRALIDSLAIYTLDDQIVVALAAFAVSYGELRLTAHVHQPPSVLRLAKLLKKFNKPDDDDTGPGNHAGSHEVLQNFLKMILEVAECILDINDLPPEYISGTPMIEMVRKKLVPAAVYMTIKGLLLSSSSLPCYIHMRDQVQQLILLGSYIHGSLKKQYDLCRQFIDEKKNHEEYEKLVFIIGSTPHKDNQQILTELLCSNSDDRPLVKWFDSSKQTFGINVLKETKKVMLLISDISITLDELFILEQTYNKDVNNIGKSYEIVWLPVIKAPITPGSKEEEKFNDLARRIKWYLPDYRKFFLEPAVVKYIRENWGFEKRPMLLVLDHQGKVVCRNALNMVCIWETLDFSSFSIKDVHEDHWTRKSWALDIFLGKITFHKVIETPAVQDKPTYVCLYGGDNIDWIKEFLKAVANVEKNADIKIKLVYVGKRNIEMVQVKNVINSIRENDEDQLRDWSEEIISSFWARLESMLNFKMQHRGAIDGSDAIVQEVIEMLSYDNDDAGWAMIGQHGSMEMVISEGKQILYCLNKYKDQLQGMNATPKELIRALKEFKLDNGRCCTRFILHEEYYSSFEPPHCCVKCMKRMEKLVIYRCSKKCKIAQEVSSICIKYI